MVNALLRVYAIDKSGIITSQTYFQSIITVFTKTFFQICEGIPADALLQERATSILDSLLTNFAKDDLLKKCLELFFPNEAISSADSNVTNERCAPVDLTGPKALEKIMKCTADFATEAIIWSIDEFNRKYQRLMTVFREFVSDSFGGTNNRAVDSLRMEIVDHILAMAWNWTDNSLLAPIFLEAGYAEAAIKWIKKLPSIGSEKQFDRAVISIVHNLSRDKKGLQTLRQNRAFESLMKYKPFANLEDVDEHNDMMQILGMSLIGLATRDHDQKQNQELICEVTEDLYDMCKGASRRKFFRYNGLHLSEILDALECAFANMSIVRHVLGNESQ
ncbi:unnamed protein product, partial [Adineta steineri]